MVDNCFRPCECCYDSADRIIRPAQVRLHMKKPTDNGWHPLISYICLDCKVATDAAGAAADYDSSAPYPQRIVPDISLTAWEESLNLDDNESVPDNMNDIIWLEGVVWAEYPAGVPTAPPPTEEQYRDPALLPNYRIEIQTNDGKPSDPAKLRQYIHTDEPYTFPISVDDIEITLDEGYIPAGQDGASVSGGN